MFGASWDVWRHSHPPLELYGTEGSLRVPDPNFFGGIVEITEQGRRLGGARFRRACRSAPSTGRRTAPRHANYRALGVAEMAAALRSGRSNHASGRLALHVLEVMNAILDAGASGKPVTMSESAERPPVLEEAEAAKLFSILRGALFSHPRA